MFIFDGLNKTESADSQELDLNKDDMQQMTSQLREGIIVKKPSVRLSGEVECDEVYVTAGHKGQAEPSKKRTSWTLPPDDAPNSDEARWTRKSRQAASNK